MKIFTRLLTKNLVKSGNSAGVSSIKLIFGKYLLITNTVTSGLLMGVGDYAAQKIEMRKVKKKIDWVRISKLIQTNYYSLFERNILKFVL